MNIGFQMIAAIALALVLADPACALEDGLGNRCHYDEIRGGVVDATGTQPPGGCLPDGQWEAIREEARKAAGEQLRRERSKVQDDRAHRKTDDP